MCIRDRHDGHWATASKDRTGLFSVPHIITEETGVRIKAWLDSGVAPVEIDHLALLQAAAINGLEALKAEHARINPPGPLWAEHSKALKAIANKADAKSKQKFEPASPDVGDGENIGVGK